MNRIDAIFADLRKSGGRALMPYITAGDPDIGGTEELVVRAARAGASVVEIGVPFSDPIADGPVIQASMTHALDRGLKTREVFEMVARVRPRVEIGIVLMVSYSIVHKMGVEAFLKESARVGVDGVILPDLPIEEGAPAMELAKKYGLILSMLIAPNTPIERARKIAQGSSGFVYLLSRAGITGERVELPKDLPERIRQIREVTSLPVAVGFGVSTAEQVGQVVAMADAAIVGSAIMRKVAQVRGLERGVFLEEMEGFLKGLAGGLKR
jgi:tryptophan synthase alpha chain